MMAFFIEGRGPAIGPARFILAFLGTLLLALHAAPTKAAAADIGVTLDQARLIRLPERVATIVIGNPLIADAAVQSGGGMGGGGQGGGVTHALAPGCRGGGVRGGEGGGGGARGGGIVG